MYLFDVFLIAHATNRITGGLIAVVTAHSSVIVVQAAVVRVVAIALGSAPKAGVAAEIDVVAAVVASG